MYQKVMKTKFEGKVKLRKEKGWQMIEIRQGVHQRSDVISLLEA